MIQRIVSALVLAPVVLVIIWAGGWWLTALIAVATVIGVQEMLRIAQAGSLHPRLMPALAIGLGFVAAAAFEPSTSLNLPLLVLTIGTLLVLVAEVLRRERTGSLEAWAITLASGAYTGGLLAFFIRLRAIEAPALAANPLQSLDIAPGAAWVFAVCAVTWASDTGAYFAGRTFGRHKMAPLLSPKKTWEGFIGGMLASVVAGIGIVALLGLPLNIGGQILLGVIGAGAGTIGDLAESLLKRQAGVKDSGSLIPGHGGLLDRVDSLLFTGPLIYYLVQLMV